jgi:hypothetical protein
MCVPTAEKEFAKCKLCGNDYYAETYSVRKYEAIGVCKSIVARYHDFRYDQEGKGNGMISTWAFMHTMLARQYIRDTKTSAVPKYPY